jgi:hypothetical protein
MGEELELQHILGYDSGFLEGVQVGNEKARIFMNMVLQFLYLFVRTNIRINRKTKSKPLEFFNRINV